MIGKKSFGEIAFDIANVAFMVVLSILFIYPVYYCLVASISNPDLLLTHSGVLLYPLGLSVGAYQIIFSSQQIVRSIFNTLFYVVAGTALNLLMTSFAAYVLSRKGFYWKKTIMFIIVFTMYFGGGLIPYYLLIRDLGLLESPLAIIVPSAINTFNVIIMRTYFMGIPYSLEESALIDGANDFTILFRIILPMAKPVIAVMVIYYGVGHWNDWFSPMIFLIKSKTWYPLTLMLRDILIANNTSKVVNYTSILESQRMARLIKYSMIIVTIVPIITVYPFMQKYFVKGVMIGSIKE